MGAIARPRAVLRVHFDRITRCRSNTRTRSFTQCVRSHTRATVRGAPSPGRSHPKVGVRLELLAARRRPRRRRPRLALAEPLEGRAVVLGHPEVEDAEVDQRRDERDVAGRRIGH